MSKRKAKKLFKKYMLQAQELRNRILELEKKVKALEENYIIIKPVEYQLLVTIEDGQLLCAFCPNQPESGLF